MSYPELPAEGTVELEIVLPAGLVLLDVGQRGQSSPQLLLVFPTVVQLKHGVQLQLLLLCPLCAAREREERQEVRRGMQVDSRNTEGDVTLIVMSRADEARGVRALDVRTV